MPDGTLMIASSLVAMFTVCETSSLAIRNVVDANLFQTPANCLKRLRTFDRRLIPEFHRDGSGRSISRCPGRFHSGPELRTRGVVRARLKGAHKAIPHPRRPMDRGAAAPGRGDLETWRSALRLCLLAAANGRDGWEFCLAGGQCFRHFRPTAIALNVPFRSTTKAPLVSGNTVILYFFATSRLNFGSSVKM